MDRQSLGVGDRISVGRTSMRNQPRHGMSGTRIHRIWSGMLYRCRSGRGIYGRRGIAVCDRWHTFENFYADMGRPPSRFHSIDRIDNDGDYEPNNCRWATRTQQARNTSMNTILEHDGREMTIAGWSEETSIKASTICVRIYKLGWTISRALTHPVAKPLPVQRPWEHVGMSRSAWYRAGRPGV